MSAEALNVAMAFARAVSSRDFGEIERLMTEDHAFIDSDGVELRGRERMLEAWAQYFQMFPDYSINVEETYVQGPVVLLVDAAEGTYAVGGRLLAENHWSVPAVWRAVARGGALAEWRVYANVEPIVKIVLRHRK